MKHASQVLGLSVLSALLPVTAAEVTPAQIQFFENQVRPILAQRCYSCHSAEAERVKADLWLDTREGVLKGGDSGPAIVPGKPAESLLVTAIRYTDPDLRMPPKGKKLPAREVAVLERWVKMGAPDPRIADVPPADWKDKSAHHWAWQPIADPPVPEVRNTSWPQNEVDQFILAKLEEAGLAPNPPADKRTLIRRAYFDLIGLPPSPEQVRAFLEDTSVDAFAKVVDELLASPHYGERWGRHWLDVARYSDTKGSVRRNREDPNSPHAWSYRDYVIRSLNEDKPYNQFVAEQIAADQLPTTANDRTALAALGFLTVGDRYMGMQDDIINDRIDVVSKAFLGLTVSCARCHDHKFDPISQRDYYALHGVFASVREPKVLPLIETVEGNPHYADYHRQLKKLILQRDRLEKEFQAARKKRDRDEIRRLQREQRKNFTALSKLEMEHPGAPARAMVVEDLPKPRNSNLLIRGERGNRGPVVPRHFLSLLSNGEPKPFEHGSGRLDLARAIVDPADPLTARVIVNRVWEHHFGEGFVPTPDDLGVMSEPPSHPELLDFLARGFVQGGWHLKQLHRDILLSATWQQSAASNPRYAEVDPANRLLWRQNIRRLEFEAIRDSLLAISGTLDPALYGRPIDLTKEPDAKRRTIYARIDRERLPEMFVQFDFATPDMPTGRRHVTTVPQQTLFFMNSPLVIELAKQVVQQPEFRGLASPEERVSFLYELLYQRQPSAEELVLGEAFVEKTPEAEPSAAPRKGKLTKKQMLAARKQRARGGADARRPPLTGWQEYAHALLQANEFIYIQ